MRQIREILKELGFNEAAPEATKQAFLRHLEQAAAVEKSTFSAAENISPNQQLAFDFTYQTEDVESEQLELNIKALSLHK